MDTEDTVTGLHIGKHLPQLIFPALGLGLRNRTGYSNPDFDAAIDEALRIGEPSARLPVLQRAVQVLDRDVPWVPLYTIRSVRIHPADLKLRFRSDGMLLLSELVPGKS